MTLAAVISSGPGAALYALRDQEYDLVVGLNRGAQAAPCDWWVFFDVKTYLWYYQAVAGEPQLFTTLTAREKLLARHHELAGRIRIPRGMDFPDPRTVNWTKWTSCATIVLLKNLGATDVHCYGMDMEGNMDFAGKQQDRRDARRWGSEAAFMLKALDWAKINFYRMVPKL